MPKDIPYAHPAWIEVDLNRFRHNIRAIRHFVQHKKICVPIKANGYGHGLIPIARAAIEAGADYLAVSCLQEGILLRQAKLQCPILVLGPAQEDQISAFLSYNLELTIPSLAKAQKIATACLALEQQVKIHIEIDTGMQRTGTRISSSHHMLDFIQDSACFKVIGVYTHLACADQPDHPTTHQQIQDFKDFITTDLNARFPKAIFHMANSGGTCYYPESHLDMVRPGKLTFGYFNTNILSDVQAVFAIKAHISYFKVVKAQHGISYGHTYTTDKDTRVVTVPIGYGDGYRRALSNKAQVLIRGKRYPIVGTICMDQFMVDIGNDEAYVGEEVVLVGKQGSDEITLEAIAQLCDTIPSEILCNFNERLPHFYIDGVQEYWEYRSLKHSTWEETV